MALHPTCAVRGVSVAPWVAGPGWELRAVDEAGPPAEEVDRWAESCWGTSPQAFSHIGLVNAVWAIGQAEAAGHG